MLKLVAAIGIVFLVLLGWIVMQSVARVFAANHPEFGPAREEGGGCGKHCGCDAGHCAQRDGTT